MGSDAFVYPAEAALTPDQSQERSVAWGSAYRRTVKMVCPSKGSGADGGLPSPPKNWQPSCSNSPNLRSSTRRLDRKIPHRHRDLEEPRRSSRNRFRFSMLSKDWARTWNRAGLSKLGRLIRSPKRPRRIRRPCRRLAAGFSKGDRVGHSRNSATST